MLALTSPLAPILAGATVHQSLFISGEWHNQVTSVILAHLALYAVLFVLFREAVGTTTTYALSHATLWMVYYLSTLYSSMLVYRLFFHRCRGFPGPILARSTKLWHTWKARNSENHLLLDELNKEYGDFVRTGPNEITIFDPQAFKVTSGYGAKCRKSVWYDFLLPSYSIVSTRNQKLHDERRQVWRHAFTPQALNLLEPRVLEHVDKMDHVIEDAVATGDPVDVTSLCHWLTFDIMGEFAFGKSFNMLDSVVYNDVILKLENAFKLLGPFSPVLWLARIGLTWLPQTWRMKDWNDMMAYCRAQMSERLKMKGAKPDIASYLIQHAEENHFSDLESKFLNGDAVTIIIAGSDPLAVTLTCALYHLAKFPEHAERLYAEIRDVDVCRAQDLKDLPQLNGVIQETMRLFPAIPTGGQRETPPEGIVVNGHYIPGHTTVAIPRYSLGRSESNFCKADQFIPERWQSQPELVKDASAHMPFGLGKSSCLGQSLALMNSKLVLARIVSKYHIKFAPGTNPEAMHTEMQDNFTLKPGPLTLLFESRS